MQPGLMLACALILTILIESAVAAVMGYRTRRDMKIIALVNVITNPALNYIILLYGVFLKNQAPESLVLMLEMTVVWIEYKLLTAALKRKNKEVFILSLSMNTASYLCGFIFF